MLIALLVVLGVELIVIVIVAALVLGRKRWLKKQPGEFTGAIRVASGEVDGLSSKWRHGSGRWVRDVLVWNKAPFMYRSEVLAIDGFSGERRAEHKEVRRLGDDPIVASFVYGTATVEVAAKAESRSRVISFDVRDARL